MYQKTHFLALARLILFLFLLFVVSGVQLPAQAQTLLAASLAPSNWTKLPGTRNIEASTTWQSRLTV